MNDQAFANRSSSVCNNQKNYCAGVPVATLLLRSIDCNAR